MAGSEIEWVDTVFNWCVRLLYDIANTFGISYEEINIWIFVIIWPLLTAALVVWIVVLIRQNKTLKCRIM